MLKRKPAAIDESPSLGELLIKKAESGVQVSEVHRYCS